MDPILVAREVRLQSPPAALWPHLSNTNRMNRALGRAPVEDEGRTDGFSREVSSIAFGFLPVRWSEAPYEYVQDRYYRNVREFSRGFLARSTWAMRLEPDGAGTRLIIEGEFIPRRALLAPFVRRQVEKTVRGAIEFAQRMDRLGAGALPAEARAATDYDPATLEARAAALRAGGGDAAAVERLIAHLRAAPDDELSHMRPFEYADRWSLPRGAVLCAFLNATRAGLLDLRWEILCPNCASSPETKTSLAEMGATSHCATCAIDYSTAGADAVELRFAAHPSVRPVSTASYCAGSPARTPHASAQCLVLAGAPKTVEVLLGSKSYAVRGLNSRRPSTLRPRPDGPSELALDLDGAAAGAELFFKPGLVRLALKSSATELARVEPGDYREAAVTAGFVTAQPDFRRLFSAEILSPGMRVGVKRLALLFTDLKDSTAMYERIGDAAAYSLVRDHFDYLFALVAARGGAVVKTIGDAVMAVFPDGGGALEAALDMQEGVAALNAKLAPRPAITLKVGVHEGPAIAIGAGGVNDYFGTTANVAARVQGESSGGDVVITDALHGDALVGAVLARRAPPEESFESRLKGLAGVQRLWRLRPRAKA